MPAPSARVAADIFGAVDRSDMRRIVVVIGPSDAILLAVLVDPVPQRLARRLPHRARGPVDADDVGRKPVTVAAAQAAAMEGAIVGGFQPARDRLAIIVAECAGDAGRETGLFG